MRRWFYILLGGLGVSLMVGAVVAMIWLTPIAQINAARALITECIAIVAGIVLGAIGFINGRNAGELDISKYMKTPRRDYGVDGKEINFACPACTKRYRASPLLAGKGFTCRDCQTIFQVWPSGQAGQAGQSNNQPPRPAERRMLPAPGLVINR